MEIKNEENKHVILDKQLEEEMYKGQNPDDICVVEESTKSIIFQLLSQLKIGMDLTRVMIPCNFLEPRSLLEKLTDFFTHGNIVIRYENIIFKLMNSVPFIDDPLERMITVLKWYMSGWHVRPKGVKKPYNPVLGEIFRTYYHMDDGSIVTFFAEQVNILL